jgi:hypothetical protein
MPFGLFGWPFACVPDRPQPGHGKSRGVTKSPKRAKRRNRRKP